MTLNSPGYHLFLSGLLNTLVAGVHWTLALGLFLHVLQCLGI